ncbi:hypothetical protein [Piscinibacter gummiphilus]|uniref:Uncharacterized protein n=1 Tax=Piscinibacter gummiphilus TaxID=946333 RepID=A0ABZ0CUE4_9BURK|nr:hypothetical protein [Piscinibacter gummiphilus]WOB06552.1 hypothetical protein RXV79_16655 [Piscinibacter gummiphilus]
MTNAKKAKALRRLAREELAGEKHIDRELVVKSETVRRNESGKVVAVMVTSVNDPFSTRGLYRGLKKSLAESVKAKPQR